MILSKRAEDATGKQFGRLLAISPERQSSNGTYWLFKCSCGKEHVARLNTVKYSLKKNGNVSCGCYELENKTKHGYRKVNNTHRAYAAYISMMDRCYNKNNNGYQWYGAKGVTVCDEWKDNPAAFVEWSIANGWEKGLHIDKDILCEELGISPHIYSPETCQWTTVQKNVAKATNRDNFGSHPNIKLSHSKVDEMCNLYSTGECTNMSELARRFNLLSPSSVSKILKKKGLK